MKIQKQTRQQFNISYTCKQIFINKRTNTAIWLSSVHYPKRNPIRSVRNCRNLSCSRIFLIHMDTRIKISMAQLTVTYDVKDLLVMPFQSINNKVNRLKIRNNDFDIFCSETSKFLSFNFLKIIFNNTIFFSASNKIYWLYELTSDGTTQQIVYVGLPYNWFIRK